MESLSGRHHSDIVRLHLGLGPSLRDLVPEKSFMDSFNLWKLLPVNIHSEAVACTVGEESMINLLALIFPLTK